VTLNSADVDNTVEDVHLVQSGKLTELRFELTLRAAALADGLWGMAMKLITKALALITTCTPAPPRQYTTAGCSCEVKLWQAAGGRLSVQGDQGQSYTYQTGRQDSHIAKLRPCAYMGRAGQGRAGQGRAGQGRVAAGHMLLQDRGIVEAGGDLHGHEPQPGELKAGAASGAHQPQQHQTQREECHHQGAQPQLQNTTIF